MASDSEVAPFARAVLITLAALALYVLSMGPVWRANSAVPEWVITAYSPIVWIGRRCEPVKKAVTWYVRFWVRNFPPPDQYP